jgi:hypothetical protein
MQFKKFSILLLVVVVILLAFHYFYSNKDSFVTNTAGSSASSSSPDRINKKNLITTGTSANQCNKQGCPISKFYSNVYQLYTDSNSIRQKNNLLANSTIGTHFFGSTKGPKNIFIIRHAEKINKINALDCNGILRSTYIPSLIQSINDEQGLGISYIITAYDYRSMHQEQTVMLASWLLDIGLFMYGTQKQSKKAVEEVFSNPNYDGKNIIFCWEHGCIQDLIGNIVKIGPKAKGIKNYKFVNPNGNSDIPAWNVNNYKSICKFDDNLNFTVSEEPFTTCYAEDNDILEYGITNKCRST